MLFVVGSVCGCCVCGFCNCVCLVAVFDRYCVVVFGWVVLLRRVIWILCLVVS